MSGFDDSEFAELYSLFQSPVCDIDCGRMCAPYNEKGIPFCCDTRHAVPTAFTVEWEYLNTHSNLWHLWKPDDELEWQRLIKETPSGQVLIECLGSEHCQRSFRSLTCRAFPFFPYFDSQKRLYGITFYWEYRDRCWIINHLNVVKVEFVQQCMDTFSRLFVMMPHEREAFIYHSAEMRKEYARQRRRIPMIDLYGVILSIDPGRETMKPIKTNRLPMYGPYRLAALLPFPDEQ